jgi:hypothetical protein
MEKPQSLSVTIVAALLATEAAIAVQLLSLTAFDQVQLVMGFALAIGLPSLAAILCMDLDDHRRGKGDPGKPSNTYMWLAMLG